MKSILFLFMFLQCGLYLFSSDKIELAVGDYNLEEGLSLISEWESETGTELVRGIVYHNLLNIDLKLEWINKGLTLLEDEYNKNSNPIALGYWGSLITLQGSYQFIHKDVIAAVVSLDEGGKKIDQSIIMDSSNIDLRFLRMINGVSVSESSPIFRGDVVEVDIKFLEDNQDQLTTYYKSLLFYYKGRYLLRQDDIDEGLKSLEKAIKFSPKSKYGLDALELLYQWEE